VSDAAIGSAFYRGKPRFSRPPRGSPFRAEDLPILDKAAQAGARTHRASRRATR
jgi:hypothetical protein